MNRFAALAAAFLVTGCVEKASHPVLPEQIIPAQITASDNDLQPGETTTLTVTLTNTLEQEVILAFPTSCQALIFIRNAAGRVTTPDGGTYECPTVPSLLTIPIGGAATFNMQWGGGIEFGPAGSSARVPPGTYFASAELRADGYHAIAFPITIEVH
jgi:hypothetical protein